MWLSFYLINSTSQFLSETLIITYSMREHWRFKKKMMYLGYVKALTVGNKLNCIIFWNTASTYQTCRIQCLAIKNIMMVISTSATPFHFFLTHISCDSHQKANRTWSSGSFCPFHSHSCPLAYRFSWTTSEPPNSLDYTWLDKMCLKSSKWD